MTDLQHITVPLVDPETGLATTVFYRYLRSLKRDVDDVGDDEQPPLSEVQVATLYSQVQDLMYTVDGLIHKSASLSKVDILQAQVQDISYSLLELDQLIWSLRASPKKDLTYISVTGGVANAISYQFINASKNATINMPSNPRDGDEVIVRNADGQLVDVLGNGKKINDSDCFRIYTKGSAVKLKFFTEGNQWFGV